MFQTELIRWLQSFATEWLTWLMATISLIGQPYIYLSILLLVILAVDFRRGVVLTNGLLYTYLAVVVVKTSFALPRPFEVDAAVRLLGSGHPNLSPFIGHGASSFLGSLPSDVVAHYRYVVNGSFGFPSGHCASAVMMWGMLALLFKRRSLAVFALIIIPLMGVSRMFLGVHFLADVLAGTLVGLAILGVGYLLSETPVLQRFLHSPSDVDVPPDFQMLTAGMLSIVLPLVLLIPDVTRTQAGTLLGLNVGAIISLRWAESLGTVRGRSVAIALCLLVIAGLFAYCRMQSWNPFQESGTLSDAVLDSIFAFALLAFPALGAHLFAAYVKPGKSK